MSTTAARLGPWSLGSGVFQWLEENLPPRKTILELGSGDGTGVLVQTWNVVSVEHDSRFLFRHPAAYIHAPIVGRWYDVSVLRRALPDSYDLIIVDGPPAKFGRLGFLENIGLFRQDVPILIDDTQRPGERDLAVAVADRLNRKWRQHTATESRSFAVVD